MLNNKPYDWEIHGWFESEDIIPQKSLITNKQVESLIDLLSTPYSNNSASDFEASGVTSVKSGESIIYPPEFDLMRTIQRGADIIIRNEEAAKWIEQRENS